MKKRTALRLMSILLAAGVCIGAVTAIVRWRSNGEIVPQRYEQVEFSRRHMSRTIEATGVVEPRNRIEIKPPIGGRIDDVLVQEGQGVTKGEIIARMSSTERATLLDAARAKGEATLKKWEDAYKPTPLIAPLDGTIIARSTEPGQTVTASDTVLVLSDRLILSARVDETDIGSIEVGQSARITLDAYRDTRVNGKVARIAYEATTVNNVTIYEVEVIPEEVPKCMKSGMTATITFMVAEVRDALTLPADAVGTQDGKSFVLVDDENPDTPPEPWRILTGLTQDGRVEVLAGLDGSETVVRAPFALVTAKETGTSPFMPGPPRRRGKK